MVINHWNKSWDDPPSKATGTCGQDVVQATEANIVGPAIATNDPMTWCYQEVLPPMGVNQTQWSNVNQTRVPDIPLKYWLVNDGILISWHIINPYITG